MKYPCIIPFLVLVATMLHGAPQVYDSPVPPGTNPAIFPVPRDNWFADVQAKFDRYSGKPFDIIFDGDSITNRWDSNGKAVWKEHLEGRAANFAIDGDRVENVLWRLQKGQVDGMNPKLVVLLIGTNNMFSPQTAEQIAEGIKVLVGEYEKRCPNAHILLMGIFPRGEKANDRCRPFAAAINGIIKNLAEDKRVTYLEIGQQLSQPDGNLSREIMGDFCHPAIKGYQILWDAIQPIVDQYVGK